MSAGKVRMGGVFIEIGADASKFFGAVNRVNQRINRLGASLRSVGSQITAGAGALAAPMGLALARFAQFDDAIRAVQAVTGSFGKAGAAAFQSMSDKARELGATTSFTAVEVANLMTELGRAGFNPSQINSMTQAVLDLARASGTDAALSAGIMSSAIRQFSLSASDATRVADVLSTAANSTFNTVEGLGEALRYAGVSASQAGMSLEETMGILGALGNVGLQGTSAGNALKRLIGISAGEAAKVKEIFGVEVMNNDGSLRGIIDIFRDIAAATEGLGSGEKLAKFNEAFGFLGMTGATAIANSVDQIDELVAKFSESEGAASRTAKSMDAGLGGSLRKAMSAIEGTALALADALVPAAQYVVDAITKVAGGITQWIKNNSELVAKIGAAVAATLALGTALVAVGTSLQVFSFSFGGILSVIGMVGGAFSGFLGLLSMAALPIAGVAAVIAGIGVALYAVGSNASSLGQTLSNAFGSVIGGGASVFGDLLASASVVFSDLGSIATTTFGGIYDAIVNGNLAGAADILWAGLYAGWLRGQEAIMNAVDPWISFFQNSFDFMGAEIYALWLQLWQKLSAGANTMGAVVQGILDNVLNGLAASWDFLEKTIRKSWIRIQGFIQGGKDVSAELKAVDDEMQARADRRSENSPGVKKRLERAAAVNAEQQQQTNDQIETIRQDANDRADDRNAENDRRAAERREVTLGAEARLNELTAAEEQTQSDRSLADTLINQLSETSDMDEFNTLIQMIEQLIAQGRLTDSQVARFDSAQQQGADNIARSQEEEGKGAARDKKMKEGAAAALDSGNVGTFSGVAISNILGSGSMSAAERTATAAEETARNTRRLIDSQSQVAE